MAGLANRMRGEAALVIDGRERRLCVTLGALAALEAAFDADAFAGLGERLGRLSAAEMLTVLSALLDGEGEPLTPAQLAGACIEPAEAARAIGEAFRLAFSDE